MRKFNVITLFLVLVILALVTSCGKDTVVYTPQQVENDLIFDGRFYLNGSDANCITLNETQPGVVDILSTCQSLVSKNPENGTFGEFPRITRTNAFVINGEIRFTSDINYNSDNDIEEDVSGDNINGRKRTDVLIKFNENNMLELTLSVWDGNNNINTVVAKRVFTEIE